MTDFETWEEQRLWDTLASGVKHIMDHGDFGKLTPEASMMTPIQNELEKRGYTEEAIQRKVAEILGVKVPENA